jgi:hypothetical protein
MKFVMWWLVVFVGLCFAGGYGKVSWGDVKDSVEKKYSGLGETVVIDGEFVYCKQEVKGSEVLCERQFYFFQDSLVMVRVVYTLPAEVYINAVVANLKKEYGEKFKIEKETLDDLGGYIVDVRRMWENDETMVKLTVSEAYNFYGTLLLRAMSAEYGSVKVFERLKKQQEESIKAEM